MEIERKPLKRDEDLSVEIVDATREKDEKEVARAEEKAKDDNILSEEGMKVIEERLPRQGSLDILRVFCGFMIAVHYFMSHGKFCPDVFKTENWTYKILDALYMPCSNALVISSAYCSVKQDMRWTRLFKYWLAILTVSVVVYFGTISQSWNKFNLDTMKIALMPYSSNKYPWVSAFITYTAFMNMFRVIFTHTTQKTHFFSILFLFFLVIDIDVYKLIDNYCKFNDGVNLPWFFALYMIGAYIRLYRIPSPIVLRLLCPFIFAGCVYLTETYKQLNKFVSFPVLTNSIILFYVFRSVRIEKECVTKILRWLGVLPFGVYLYLYNHILAGKLPTKVFDVKAYNTGDDAPWNMLRLALVACLVCGGIEIVRQVAFLLIGKLCYILHIRPSGKAVEKLVDKLYDAL